MENYLYVIYLTVLPVYYMLAFFYNNKQRRCSMRKHRLSLIVILLFILLAHLTLSEAAEQKIPLKGDFWKSASGEAVIKDMAQGQKEISIDAKGLNANGVYTVWFVNMKPKMDMTGVGIGDYSFKTDAKGEGHYMANVPAAEIEKWQMLEVAYHPDGDPKNMKDIKIALKAILGK